MTEDELIADRKAVVKVVNRIRKKTGMGSTSRLTKGVRIHPGACTLAMSLAGTGITGVDYDGDRVIFRLVSDMSVECVGPEASTVARFLSNYDDGLYPELEIPKSEIKVGGQVIA